MKDLHILPKVRDSWSHLYVEHCKIDQDEKAIAVHDVQRPGAGLLRDIDPADAGSGEHDFACRDPLPGRQRLYGRLVW